MHRRRRCQARTILREPQKYCSTQTMGAIATSINWLTTGWSSADVIGLSITLGGLWATYRQARKAKSVAEETRENVARDLGRIKVNLSSFNLLEKIHTALSAIDLAKDALISEEYARVIGHFEVIVENLTLLSDEELACVSNRKEEIQNSVKYLNEKIDNIGEQMTKNKITESQHKVSQVIRNIRSLLKQIERALEKDTFDGGQ